MTEGLQNLIVQASMATNIQVELYTIVEEQPEVKALKVVGKSSARIEELLRHTAYFIGQQYGKIINYEKICRLLMHEMTSLTREVGDDIILY